MNDRFERQRDSVPMPRLADLIVTVIGVGAIGRQVVLAARGNRRSPVAVDRFRSC